MTENQNACEIRAVKLRRKGDEGFVPEIIVHDPESKLNRTYSDCENLCHSDLVKSISRLNHHIAVLTDKISTDKFEDDPEIDEIMVARGFSYSGAEDELRVTLKGYQKTKRGGTFQINTPVVYVNQDENKDDAYFFLADLNEKLKRIALEAKLYIFSGKRYEDPQMSLNMPDPDEKVTKAQIDTPESIVKDLVDTTNGTPPVTREKGRKQPQSASNRSGAAK